MMQNYIGQQGRQPGMGQPQMGAPQQPGGPQMPGMPGPPQGGPPMGQQQPPQGGMPPPRQAGPQMGGPPQGGGMPQVERGMFRGLTSGQPGDDQIRQLEHQLMMAQMQGASPMELGNLQLALQNAQRDFGQAQEGYDDRQRQGYLQEMQRTAGRGPGIGGSPGNSGLQNPFLTQLIAQQYGQGGGGGIRS